MAAKTNFLEDALIDHVTGVAAYTAPAQLYLALFSVAPSEGSEGTELTGGGYARTAINFDAASGGTADNQEVTFPAATANWLPVVGGAIYDASTAGNQLLYVAQGNVQINSGQSFVAAAGDVTYSES